MSTENTNIAIENNNNENNSESTNKVTIKGKIIAVTTFKDETNRIQIKMNCPKFITIHKGKSVETDTFGISSRLATDQTKEFVPELALATTLALGKTLNPQIIALCLTNAEIEIVRELRKKGTPTRANEIGARADELYEEDTWVTDIVKCKPNIASTFQPFIMQLISTAVAVAEPKPAMTANPFAALGL